MKIIIFLLFICSQAFSQTINFKGKLLDKKTDEPIVYANISFLKTNTGISSLEDGTFSLEIEESLLKEKVHISCLNYKDTIVFAKELYNKTLFLEAKSFELDEVVISRKVDKEIIVNKIKKRKVKVALIGTGKFPWTVARYFEFKKEYKETPYLKNAIIFLSNREKRKAKFKVRVLTKDSIYDLPKDDLIKEILLVSVDEKDIKVVLDLSKYDIEIPEKGLFIALERLHIPENFYEDVFNYKDSISEKVIRVAPNFGGVLDGSFPKYVYRRGKWSSTKKGIGYKEERIVPAISLTLSN